MRQRLIARGAGLMSLGVGLAALALDSGVVSAQEAGTTNAESDGGLALQEIVVTATKQAEPLSKVPSSIVAMDQQTMDANGVKSMADVAAMTPGVDFGSASYSNGSVTQITIRGISESLNTEPTTGVYIDDTPVTARDSQNSMFGNPYPLVFDLDRVEVLRGPQGTLFGAGSEAGTVRFITPQPSLTTYSAYTRAEVADTMSGAPSYEAGGALGGPVVDNELGFRVSAWFRRDGGWVDRQNYETGDLTPNSNWSNSAAVRGALTFAPTENVLITPSIYYQDVHTADTAAYWLSLSNPGERRFVDGNVLASASTDRFSLPTLKVAADLTSVKLESITSYFYRSGNAVVDGTFFENFAWGGLAYPTIPGYSAPQLNSQNQNILTQEFRVSSQQPDSRFKWVAGLYYSNSRQEDVTHVQDEYFPELILETYGAPAEEIFGVGLTDGKYVLTSTDTSQEEQVAVYAHGEVKLTDALGLSAGLRYANAKLTYGEQDGGPAYGGSHSFSGSQIHNPVTPQASLQYQLTPTGMAYVTVAEGYRLGGINGPVTPTDSCLAALGTLGLTSPPNSYNPDTLWNYEIGTKLRFLDNRVALDMSAFHDVWNHIQEYVALPACAYLGFTANLGRANSNGFDLSLAARITGGLQASLGVGYTDAKYAQTIGQGSAIVVSKGDTLGNAPWAVTFTPEYHFSVFGKNDAYIRAQDQFHSHNGGTSAGTDPNSISYDSSIPLPPSTNLLNLRVGMLWSGIDASIFVNNVLNAHPDLRLAHPEVGDPLYNGLTFRPLTAGVTMTYRY